MNCKSVVITAPKRFLEAQCDLNKFYKVLSYFYYILLGKNWKKCDWGLGYRKLGFKIFENSDEFRFMKRKSKQQKFCTRFSSHPKPINNRDRKESRPTTNKTINFKNLKFQKTERNVETYPQYLCSHSK